MSNVYLPLHGTQVTFEFLRHVGPRLVHGGVTLSFQASSQYEFVSQSQWPEADNYDSAVREGVEHVFMQRYGTLSGVKVILEQISWDSINSSKSGFHHAAVAATLAAISVIDVNTE